MMSKQLRYRIPEAELRKKLEAHERWLDTMWQLSDRGKTLPEDWTGQEDNGTGACLDLSYTDLSDVDLSGKRLCFANFDSASLSGVNLQGADLFGAYMPTAKLYNVDLFGADLRDVFMPNADLFRKRI